MEYVYAAMILHSAGKTIDEKGITAVLESAGVDVDAARVKGPVSYTHLTLPTIVGV